VNEQTVIRSSEKESERVLAVRATMAGNREEKGSALLDILRRNDPGVNRGDIDLHWHKHGKRQISLKYSVCV